MYHPLLRIGLAASALSVSSLVLASTGTRSPATDDLGLFESSQDVGTVLHAGSVTFDETKGRTPSPAAARTCGSPKIALQFVWKKVSGDLSFAADIRFTGTGKTLTARRA